MLTEGIKYCPFGSFKFMMFRATGSMSEAVRDVPNDALASAARQPAERFVSVNPASVVTWENELSWSTARCP